MLLSGSNTHTAIDVPKVLYSEGAGSMSNDNDEQSIGNTIRGTNVSQPGYSEQSVPEDTAFMAAADLGRRGISSHSGII
jgi:hypothetical protein